MNTATAQERAKALALKATEEFDFDCREVVSSDPAGVNSGEAVFRIVIHLWSSSKRIDQEIEKYKGKDVELMREILVDGHKIAIDATHSRVVNQQWIGIQFS